MKELLQYIKEHPVWAVIFTVMAALAFVLSNLSTFWGILDVLGALPGWIDSSWARAALAITAFLIFLGFWVVTPAVHGKARGAQIDKCLEDLASIHESGDHLVEQAMAAGSILLKCKELGAFTHAGVLDHELDLAQRRLLVVQQNARYAASEPEYQAFFVVAKAARQYAGAQTSYPVTPDVVAENLLLIPPFVRHIRAPRRKRGTE